MAGMLGDLLAPLDLEAFFQESWERKVAVARRAGERRFDSILSMRRIAAMLDSGVIGAGSVRLLHDGLERSAPTVGGTRIDPDAIVRAYAHGESALFCDVGAWSPEVARLCDDVARTVGHPTGANAYLSPARSQGLPRHYDRHDVFVLQVEGRKTWTFYAGGPKLPLDKADADALAGLEPSLEIELEPGDVVYIPRGEVHEVYASSRSSSLHLAVGVYQVTWRQLAQEALAAAAAVDPGLRTGLPIDWRDGAADGALAEGLRRWLGPEALQGLDAALASLRARAPAPPRPACLGSDDDGFAQIDRLKALRSTTLLRQAAPGAIRIEGATVSAPGVRFELGADALAPMSWLAARPEFRIADMPDATPVEARFRLVEDLVRLGVLRMEAVT